MRLSHQYIYTYYIFNNIYFWTSYVVVRRLLAAVVFESELLFRR